MSDYLKYQNLDEIYHRLLTDKILINRVDIFNEETKNILDSIIMKNYSEDNLSIIPSCQCGELKGGYYLGDTCHKCNTRVVNGLDDAISFLLWVERPKEVEFFISPILMANLLDRYKITRPSVKLVEYIMLPNFKIDKKQQKSNLPVLERLDFLLAQNGIERGYNSFVQNFFKIVEILESEFVKKKATDEGDFLALLHANKHNFFSNFLPFPNKILFASETNELGRFVDRAILSPINTIRRLTGIDLHTRPSSVKQAKVARSLIDISQFYMSYIEDVVFGKPGLIRQQLTATRSHFTGRAVIVSIAGIHEHDEIHIPWSMGCSLMRPFLLASLYRRGYSYRAAINFLTFYNRIYHPLIDEMFNEFIASSMNKNGKIGLTCLFNRNPSLHRGSIQTVRATRFKTDPEDNTISMSDRIGPSFNSDHDGDEMNLALALTDEVVDSLEGLEPYHNVLGLTGPDEISNNIKFPKTLIKTFANYFNGLK